MNKYQEAMDYYWRLYNKGNLYGDTSKEWLEVLQELVDKTDSFEWIPVTERLPKEHASIFAKWYGTDELNSNLWRTTSNRVLVTVKYDDGTRIVKESHIRDGEWADEKRCIKCKVEAWMPLPAPYKGEENERY